MIRMRAFTILEVMVALTLTAVIVSLSFSGLRLVKLQFLQFQHQQEKVEATRRCLTLLKWDVTRSRYVVRQEQQLRFLSAADSIRYTFGPTVVIREYGTQQRDSFVVNLSIQNATFTQRPGEGLVDEVSIAVALTEFVKTAYLHKAYSAHDLILWEDEH